MTYKIVYDQPGRIRFRCGGYAFDKALEYGIYKLVSDAEFVTRAEVRSENGGILVYYGEGARQRVIDLVSGINPRELEILSPDTEYGITEIDRDFENRLAAAIGKKLLSTILLPMSVRKYLILFRGLKFVLRGIKTLLEGQLTVDVLDGASIGACLLQRNYKTAGTVMFLLNISGLLESYTRARTRAVLADSLAVKTDKVWLIKDGTDILIPMSELRKDDMIRVRTGSVIPVDGEVFDGEAYINESSMTGEPIAVMKSS